MEQAPVYLDYNATTPLLPEVADAIYDAGVRLFGNPSSSHYYGRLANNAVQQARVQLAALISAQPSEIVFTGCATEANNLALLGVAAIIPPARRHLIISAVEHPAVMQPALRLRDQGWRLTVLKVDQAGRINPDELEDVITESTALVSVMHANNETGTTQPIEHVHRIASEHGALLHVDAAQSVGKVAVDVATLGADMLTVAGHKFYAPKGIGALYIRQGVQLGSLTFGAGHESGLRPGTENVMHIVGIGAAAEHSMSIQGIGAHLMQLRDMLHRRLQDSIPELLLNGHPDYRLPNTLNVSFPGISGTRLLEATAGDVAASVGSACHSGSAQVSGVLAAMGIEFERANGAVRLSVGRLTTEQEIERAAASLVKHYRHCVKEQ